MPTSIAARLQPLASQVSSSDGIESIHYRGLEVGDPEGNAEIRLGDFTISDLGFPSLAAIAAFEEAQGSGRRRDQSCAPSPTLGGILVSDLLVDVPKHRRESALRAANPPPWAEHIGPIPTRGWRPSSRICACRPG